MLSNNLFIQLMVTDSLDQFSRHVEETCCSDFYKASKSEKPKFSIFLVLCCAKLLQLCPALCNLMDYSPPGSSVHGFSRQEYWSGSPCHSPGDLPDPGNECTSPALQANSLPLSPQGSSNSPLCDKLEGWNGVRDGREVHETGDIHILMADSC